MRRSVHHGKVLSSADPDKLGGAEVQINELVDGDVLDDDFVPGRSPFAGNGEGFYYAPQEGALLEVEVDADEEGSVEDIAARWVGMLFTSNDAIPAEFSSDAENRGGVKFGEEVFLQDKKEALTALISAKLRLGEEAASHPVMRGDTYNAQFETFMTALDAYLTADAALATSMTSVWTALAAAATGVLAPLATPFQNGAAAWTAYAAAVPTFKAAVAAFKAAKSTWLSTKVKTE